MSRSVPSADVRRALWFVTAFVTGLGGILVSSAHAQATELVDLAWHAPADCPDAASIHERIRKLSGSSQATTKRLRAAATITRLAGGRLHLSLVVEAGGLRSERNIAGRSCEDLAGAAAVSLALLLRSAKSPGETEPAGGVQGADPTKARTAVGASSLRGEERSPSALVGVVEPAPETAQPTQPNVDGVRAPRSWRGLLQLPLVVLGLGPLPRPSFGAALGGGVRLERWRILAEGGVWLRQKLTVEGPVELGATVDRFEVGLRVCRAFSFGRYELAPCANVSVGHLWARGTGAHVAARTVESTSIAAGLAVQARLQLTPWLNLFGSFDALLETSRPRFTVGGLGQVGQLGPAALKITLGSEWIL